MAQHQVTVHPCAKINVGLYITGRRSDGYHTLETIFFPVTLFDTICIRRRKRGVAFFCDSPVVPSDESNLVYRAAEKFFEAWDTKGEQDGVSITLIKKIPVGGGLGGGSSDAAYTLIGLQQLFGSPVKWSIIRGLTGELGADVPFFLESRVCLGQGIGEHLTPVDLHYPGYILLVWPDFPISTGEVFKKVTFGLTRKNKLNNFIASDKIKNFFLTLKSISNELELIVFPQYPELKVIKDTLYHLGAEYSSLSGSGSTVYGFFSKKEQAERAAQALSSHYHTAITRQYVPHI